MRAIIFIVLALLHLSCVHCAYKLINPKDESYGSSGQLQLTSPGPYGNDISLLNLQVYYQTADIVRIKITDPKNKRWEVPGVNILPLPTSKPAKVNYRVEYTGAAEFGFSVVRAANGEAIFNTSVPQTTSLVFEDHFLEIGTTLPQDFNIYGLGERITSFRLPAGKTWTLYNKDWGTPVEKNLYGSHAFYLELRKGLAHGVYLLNSNPMDIITSQTSLTYKTIGGILDFFVFLGSSPIDVIQQYHSVIGKPYMPPYWGLGFHQCRWGYHNLNDTRTVVEKYAANNLPLDTMWNDIDYMNAYRDFELDPKNFPVAQMRQFVKDLHAKGQHYVMIVDPGISINNNYPTFQSLVKSGAYIKNANGSPLIGKVWPGEVYFPDFLHPNAQNFWTEQLQNYHNTGPEFDGVWIDMNEASNFCDGQCRFSLGESTGAASNINLPYIPGGVSLDSKSINITALTYLGPQYDTHNLYGWGEGQATKNAAEKILGTRTIVISRSTFAGSGSHNGHWLGDNNSHFDDLYYSIPGILSMQLFGVNLVGADICGFGGDTTEELCSRWMQLGAFYPFSRNHNAIGSRSQEPYAFGPTLLGVSRDALLRRYSLLPYMYTLFYLANTQADLIWNPLFFVYPNDTNTYGIDKQFLVGDALLVSPVLTAGATSVSAYFPKDNWYDWYTGAPLGGGQGQKTLDAPITHIPVHIRGGSVIATQKPELTTAKTRLNPYTLLVATGQNNNAKGSLFLDDGISLNTIGKSSYTFISFELNNNQQGWSFTSTVKGSGYGGVDKLTFANVTFLGIAKKPSSVTLNKVATPFNFFQDTERLVVSGLSIPVAKEFAIEFKN